MRSVLFLILAAGTLLGCLPGTRSTRDSQAAAAPEQPWTVDFSGPRGLTVAYRGVPIIRQSTLYVVKPGWTGVLFDQRLQAPEITPQPNAAGASLRVTAASDVFRAEHRLEALDDRRFRLRFEGRLLQDVPAELEYGAGYFNANLLAARPFRADTVSGRRAGVVPAFPATSGQVENDLAPSFRSLEFDSRIGKLRLEATADQRVMFFDARRDTQDWAKAAPVFWCGLGVPARRLTYGAPVKLELLLTVEPHAVPQAAAAPLELPEKWRAVPAAQSSVDRPLLLIPRPKSVKRGKGGFSIGDGVPWSITGAGSDPRLRAELMSLLRDRMGLKPGAGAARGPSGHPVRIQLGSVSEPPMRPVSGSTAPRWSSNPEGYRLGVGSQGVVIESTTAQGAFYGLQTLAQLARPAQGGMWCPAIQIEDWPTLAFRGAHWFPSASGIPFHRKLIQRIMARYKLNAAVIQCEAARWSSHPEIAAPNSISRADLTGLVNLARQNFIDPIPLINTPGHAEWMFRNGQNRTLAEDPQTPYAYCVNHPDSDRFIKQILEETLEVFKPTSFHLGHDEVTMRGRFPRPDCPRCAGKSVTELVMTHAQRLNEWAVARKVRPMVWGDMLLAKGEVPDAAHAPNATEARARRALLPKNMTVADWHYGAGAAYPSLDLLKQEGLDTLACTWYEPLNIYHFAQAARKAESLGLLQTTWAGYFPDETVLKSELRQFSAFILAAEYAWSGRPERPEDLPYTPGAEFTRSYFGDGDHAQAGAILDLAPAARVARKDWLGLGAGWDLSGLPGGTRRVGEVLFDIPADRLVVLGAAPHGAGLLPQGAAQSLTVPVGKKIRQAALLNAALWSVPAGTPVVRLTVEYTDGKEVSETLTTGRATGSWSDDAPALRAPLAWRAKSPAGTPLGLRVTRWDNPHPLRTVARLRFDAVNPEAGWALAGLTLLQ